MEIFIIILVVIFFAFIFTNQRIGFNKREYLQSVSFIKNDLEVLQKKNIELQRELYDIKYTQSKRS